jgi:hypothetical protein
MRKQIVRLTESDLHRIIKKSVNRLMERIEDYYPEVYDDENYIDDSYPEYYDEFINAEDPTYTAHKNDFNGILSILRQYGITDAEINDSDPEGEYPPTLEIKVPSEVGKRYSEEIENVVCSRGWRLINVEPTYGGEVWSFGKDVNESIIRRAVRESLKRLVETDCAGVMQTGSGNAPKGTNPEAGQYTVPFGADKETADRTPGKVAMGGKAKWNVNNGNVQRRPIYNPKSGK